MNSAIGWLLYFAAVAGLIVVGWDEPLGIHFMSPANAAALRAQGQPTGDWMRDSRRWDTSTRTPASPLALPTPPPQKP